MGGTDLMEFVTSLETLMQYDYELGQARLSGDKERIKLAKEKYDVYHDMVMQSDRVIIPQDVGTYINGGFV